MCTRIFWNDNQLAAVVGRTMDWPESTEPVITVFPRGAERHGYGRAAGRSRREPTDLGRHVCQPGHHHLRRRHRRRAERARPRRAPAVSHRDRLRPSGCTEAGAPRRALGAVPARQRCYRLGGPGPARGRADRDGRGARRARHRAPRPRRCGRRLGDRRVHRRRACRPPRERVPRHDQRPALRPATGPAPGSTSRTPAATRRCPATWRPPTASRAPATTRRCCRSPGPSAKRWPACSRSRATSRSPSGRPTRASASTTPSTARCRNSPTAATSSSSRPAPT